MQPAQPSSAAKPQMPKKKNAGVGCPPIIVSYTGKPIEHPIASKPPVPAKAAIVKKLLSRGFGFFTEASPTQFVGRHPTRSVLRS